MSRLFFLQIFIVFLHFQIKNIKIASNESFPFGLNLHSLPIASNIKVKTHVKHLCQCGKDFAALFWYRSWIFSTPCIGIIKMSHLL